MVSETGHSRGIRLTRRLFLSSTMALIVVVLGGYVGDIFSIGSFACMTRNPLTIIDVGIGAGHTW